MILQSSHVVVDCPICGRPLEMSSQFINSEVVCSHCLGEFTMYETDKGSLATSHRRGTNALKRAERLLLATSDAGLSYSDRCSQQEISQLSARDAKRCPKASPNTLPEGAECEHEPQRTVLLVEYRDEIFARLASDMAEFGMRVVRAKSATEALKLVETYKPVLLVANVDLPGQSGWLMTAKLRLFNPQIRVWLYRPQPSGYGREIAKILDIDTLLAYHGDLFGLSGTIVDRMAIRYEPQNGENNIDRAEESTAA